ncbi:DNA alkylation repair protein [Levilactobacillus yonginensis]|uniref:DNA alkylation repair protein n=1 Tax=Levilactobacillus yonginensis TaxID=1054041 RepID=UPI000F76E599|nr:DNA alkylation repair protein [Levilactobacillus yonginensis]
MELTTTVWTAATYQEFLQDLRDLGDDHFRDRSAKIVATERPLLGIPMKTLRSLGVAISQGMPHDFLAVAGTEYYEAVIIQGYVLSRLPLDVAYFTKLCDAYISKAENWSVCDMVIHFNQVKAFRAEFLTVIQRYLQSDNPWFQRTGLVFLLKFYLTPEFTEVALQLAVSVVSTNYYVQMGQAWLLAAAFPNQQATIYHLLRTEFSLPVVQRTVQKIKSLRHTTTNEKASLTALLAEKRTEAKRRGGQA